MSLSVLYHNCHVSVSVYEIDGTTYTVKTFFDLDCKETLADIVDRLIIK